MYGGLPIASSTCVERGAGNAVSATQLLKSLPNTAPTPVDRVGPRMHLPKIGPADVEYASESEEVEDDTLQAPDGALGVLRCLPLPPAMPRCFDDGCVAFEHLKSSVDGLLNDEGAVFVDEEDEYPLPVCIPPHARPIFSTARFASPAEKPLVILTAVCLIVRGVGPLRSMRGRR